MKFNEKNQFKVLHKCKLVRDFGHHSLLGIRSKITDLHTNNDGFPPIIHHLVSLSLWTKNPCRQISKRMEAFGLVCISYRAVRQNQNCESRCFGKTLHIKYNGREITKNKSISVICWNHQNMHSSGGFAAGGMGEEGEGRREVEVSADKGVVWGCKVKLHRYIPLKLRTYFQELCGHFITLGKTHAYESALLRLFLIYSNTHAPVSIK